ncbi:NAD-dependent epimerase/dehydratase family protein [Actinokineospora guangxiensis]|uniref:NAD-dependent epimerase/dehydratase family protein n=1 Tax=Actinokineospora guangxiensis TaxID=1490288 RepID=A0ABW0EJX1_9PSEU
MNVLVLGGTGFIGREIVTDLLGHGARVTLFNRGTSALFPGLPRLIGDRESGEYPSMGGPWDAVVDVSGYVPRHVAQSMAAVGEVGRYLFISSHVVYAPTGPGADEDSPRREPVRDTEFLTDDTYGPCKVACEDDITARYGDRATIVRPSKVAGPHDPQHGLVDWLRAVAEGGRVEVSADPAQPVQLVDSRDLARLVTRLLSDDCGGAFNACGPTTPLGELIRLCASAAGTDIDLVRVPDAPGPLLKTDWATQHRSSARAHAAGMPVTPVERTVADVQAWLSTCA